MRIATGRTAGWSRVRAGLLATALTASLVVVSGGAAAEAAPFDDEYTMNCKAGTFDAERWTTDHALAVTPGSGGDLNVTYSFDAGASIERVPPFVTIPAGEMIPIAHLSVDGGAPVAVQGPAYGALRGGTIMPGATITGTVPFAGSGTASVRVHQVEFRYTGGSSPQTFCNDGADPIAAAETTDIVATTTVAADPVVTVDSVDGQSVTTHARRGNTINLSVSGYAPDGTATVNLCSTSGDGCQYDLRIALDGSGAGSGALTLGSPNPTTGSRALRVSDGTASKLQPITILANNGSVAVATTEAPAGTAVTVTGTNFDPGSVVKVGGFKVDPSKACPPNCPPVTITSDAPAETTADATGAFSTTFTPTDPATSHIGAIGGGRWDLDLPLPSVYGSSSFSVIADGCTDDTCLDYDVEVDILPEGVLAMARDAGSETITMGMVGTSAEEQTTDGVLDRVRIVDTRAGTTGWSLVATMSDLEDGNGVGDDIPAENMWWDPTCVKASQSSKSTPVPGSEGTLSSTTASTLCSAPNAAGGTGGTFNAGAALELTVPAFQNAGDYAGVLTLTLS